jgi:hypothetical protein
MGLRLPNRIGSKIKYLSGKHFGGKSVGSPAAEKSSRHDMQTRTFFRLERHPAESPRFARGDWGPRGLMRRRGLLPTQFPFRAEFCNNHFLLPVWDS